MIIILSIGLCWLVGYTFLGISDLLERKWGNK